MSLTDVRIFALSDGLFHDTYLTELKCEAGQAQTHSAALVELGNPTGSG